MYDNGPGNPSDRNAAEQFDQGVTESDQPSNTAKQDDYSDQFDSSKSRVCVNGQAEVDTVDVRRYTNQTEVLHSVLALEKRNFAKADSWAGILEREIKRRNTVLLYACLLTTPSKIVGYIIYTTNQLTVHIQKVAVERHHRRQGIGRKLVQEALLLANKERKVWCATLHVDPTNEAAWKLYQGLGFVVSAELQDYYSLGRPAWKMLLEEVT